MAKVASPVSASSGNSFTSIPSSNESVDSHPELLSDPLSESIAASSELEEGGHGGREGPVFEMGAAAIALVSAGSRLENGQMTIYKYISRLSFC